MREGVRVWVWECDAVGVRRLETLEVSEYVCIGVSYQNKISKIE